MCPSRSSLSVAALCCASAALLILGGTATAQAADPFVGHFGGDGVQLKVRAASGQKYRGALLWRGKAHDYRASRSGAKMMGTFVVGGEKRIFFFAPAGDRATLRLSGKTYQLVRGGAANALAMRRARRQAKRANAKVSARRFMGALTFAFGGGLSRAESSAVFKACTGPGKYDASALKFQEWDDVARKMKRASTRQQRTARQRAQRDLLNRMQRGQRVEPWRTVGRIVQARRKASASRTPARRPRGPQQVTRRPATTTTPGVNTRNAVIGHWFIGNPGADWVNVSSGATRLTGDAESYTFHPNGRYEHVIIKKAGYQTIATYEAGTYLVKGNIIFFRVVRTDGFQQYGRKRQKLGPRRAQPRPRRFTIGRAFKGSATPTLVLDGVTRLVRRR